MKLYTPKPPHGQKSNRTLAKATNDVRTWIKRSLIILVVIIIVLPVIGATYQLIATKTDEANYPPPGKMVDVGGYRLHINCMGSQLNDDVPTVILLDGLPSMSIVWTYVQPAVAQTARVCAYDRGGGGWSESGPKPRDPQHIATELHTLLGEAGISGPYILVAHSFGGLYARMYADLYPQDIVGMVLVDSSHPDMWVRLPKEIMEAMLPAAPQRFFQSAMYRLGIIRLTSGGDLTQNCPVPPQQCAENLAFNLSGKYWDAWQAEMFAPDRDAQVRATGDLGDTPLIVLTAGDHSRDFTAQTANSSDAFRALFEESWQELQNELAGLSSNSLHLVVAGAGHDSFQLDPKYYSLTIESINQVVEAAQTGQLLAAK